MIEERLVKLCNTKSVLTAYDAESRGKICDSREAAVLRVTLDDDTNFGEETFVWNIAGPQQGFFNALEDWDTVYKKHVKSEILTEDFGDRSEHAQSNLSWMMDEETQDGDPVLYNYIRDVVFADWLVDAIVITERLLDKHMRMTLTLGQEHYMSFKPAFLMFFRVLMRACKYWYGGRHL